MKKLLSTIFIFALFVSFYFPALAEDEVTQDTVNSKMVEQSEALTKSSGLNINSSLPNIISQAILVALGFLGVIFLVLTIMAGYKWMMAQGNETIIKEAKDSLKNSIIGLAIVLAAYIITNGVFLYLPFATGGGGGVETSS